MGDPGGLGCYALEDVVYEGVHDRHCLGFGWHVEECMCTLPVKAGRTYVTTCRRHNARYPVELRTYNDNIHCSRIFFKLQIVQRIQSGCNQLLVYFSTPHRQHLSPFPSHSHHCLCPHHTVCVFSLAIGSLNAFQWFITRRHH